MLVHVDITIQDIKSLGKAALMRARRFPRMQSRPWPKRLMLGGAFVAQAVIFVAALQYFDLSLRTHLPLSLMISVIFCSAFLYFFMEDQRRLYPNENGMMLGAKTYEIGESGVTQSWRHGESTLQWAAICGVETTDAHIFLFIDRNAAFILPKRCFSSDEQMAEFMTQVERHTKIDT